MMSSIVWALATSGLATLAKFLSEIGATLMVSIGRRPAVPEQAFCDGGRFAMPLLPSPSQRGHAATGRPYRCVKLAFERCCLEKMRLDLP